VYLGDGPLVYLSNLSVAGSGVERTKEMRKDIMAAGGEGGGMQEGRDQDAAQPETEVRASVRNHQIGDNTVKCLAERQYLPG
jgi:hypothetical protein